MTSVNRLFLDANILFSAPYRAGAGIAKLWQLPAAELVTSAYAAEEARRNLSAGHQLARFAELLGKVTVIPTQPVEYSLSPQVSLPDKDKPILLAAIHAQATHLITGDFRNFGPYYGQMVEGVHIVSPGLYLRDLP